MKKFLFILLFISNIVCSGYIISEREAQISSLIQAIENADLDAVKQIIDEAGIDIVNMVSSSNDTLLELSVYHACKFQYLPEHVNILKFFISKGANINFPAEYSSGILYWPCREGRLEILEFLVKNGANIDYVDYLGKSYLSIAIEYRQYDIIKYLLKNGIDIDKSIETHYISLLHKAVITEDFGLLNKILSNKKLLESCKDCVDKSGMTPLHYACMFGNLKVVKFLLKNKEALGIQVSRLCTIGGPLHIACSYNKKNIVRYLLENKEAIGLDINFKNSDGQTALFRCLSKLSIAKLLIKYGIDIDAKDIRSQSAILSATWIYYNALEFIKYLVLKNADLTDFIDKFVLREVGNDKKLIELYLACIRGDLEVIEKAINAKNLFIDNKTLLYYACKFYNFDLVNFLIKKDIYSNIEIEKSITDDCYKAYYDNKEIIRILSNIELPYGIHIDGNSPIICKANRKLYSIFSSEMDPMLSLYQNIKNIKHHISKIILSNEIDAIRELHDLDLLFTEQEIADLIVFQISRIDINENILVELIRRVNLSFDLTDLIDSNGENLLTNALMKNKLNLSLVLIYLNRSLLDQVNWSLSDAKIVDIYNIIKNNN